MNKKCKKNKPVSVKSGPVIEVIKKLESARTPASLAATDAGTRSAHW